MTGVFRGLEGERVSNSPESDRENRVSSLAMRLLQCPTHLTLRCGVRNHNFALSPPPSSYDSAMICYACVNCDGRRPRLVRVYTQFSLPCQRSSSAPLVSPPPSSLLSSIVDYLLHPFASLCKDRQVPIHPSVAADNRSAQDTLRSGYRSTTKEG